MKNLAPALSEAEPNEPYAPSETIPLRLGQQSLTNTDPCAPRSAAQNQNSKTKIPKSARPRSKIAHLPKKLRDLINESLSDGATYAQVVQRLNQSTDPPLPYPISERNISDWFTGPHQDWLRHQDHLDLLSTKFDFALDLAQNSQPDKLQELCLQLAAIRMCEFLSEMAIADPQNDPAIYLRLLSALPRISKEALNLQKYRDTLAAARKTAAPVDNLTPEERAEAARTALLDRFDDIMGLKSYRKPFYPPPSAGSGPSSPADSPAVPQSKIENQNSKIPEIPPTDTSGNLQKPNSASDLAIVPVPVPQPSTSPPHSSINPAIQ